MSERHGSGREIGGSGRHGRLRARLGLALVVAAALAALPPTVARIRSVVASRPAQGDDLSVFYRRLEPVRAALTVERVGYLPRTALRGSPELLIYDQHFMATRYALAPTLVVPKADRRLVFADLAVESDPSGAIPDSLTIERDFGDGLVLLRRKEQ